MFRVSVVILIASGIELCFWHLLWAKTPVTGLASSDVCSKRKLFFYCLVSYVSSPCTYVPEHIVSTCVFFFTVNKFLVFVKEIK